MSQSRQELADGSSFALGLKWQLASFGRYWLRQIAYGFSPLIRHLEPEASPHAAQDWDGLLEATSTSTYLGHTIDIDTRNHVISTLIKYHARPEPAVLDVGCCGGTLMGALASCSRYLGLDISAYAIKQAQNDPALAEHVSRGTASYEAVDLRGYRLTQAWDAIVFSEVLYYLKTDEAVEMVVHYARSLSSSGVVIISMKDDAKSSAIFAKLSRHMRWADGAVWQRKPAKAEFRIRVSRERPGYLAGVLVPGRPPAGRLAAPRSAPLHPVGVPH